MRSILLTLVLLSASPASAQEAEEPTVEGPAAPELSAVDAPAVDAQHADPGEPIYAAWWFWTGIGAVVIGITLAIVVDVTTDDPAPSDVGMTIMTLRY